jgi:hypothetical protein
MVGLAPHATVHAVNIRSDWRRDFGMGGLDPDQRRSVAASKALTPVSRDLVCRLTLA